MEAKTRKKIDAVLDEAVELADSGMDEFAAARQALTAQTTDVLRELAVAAIVDVVRRRQRMEALTIERAAVKPKVAREGVGRPLTPNAAGIRKGTAAYWSWVESTPEGARYEAEESERSARFAADIYGAIDTLTKSLRVEWTAELLESDFALPDGTRVTWGDATVEQHEQRAALFIRNATANAEGAARHMKAVEALSSSGRSTLNELVGVAA